MKGILKYKNKTSKIKFKDIPTLYAIMDNLENKPTFEEKKELIISKENNIILSKDRVFNPEHKDTTYLRKSTFTPKGIKGFQGCRLFRFNGYEVIQK